MKERKEQDLLQALEDSYQQDEPVAAKAEGQSSDKKVATSPAKAQKPATTEPSVGSETVVYLDGENTFFQFFDELRRQKLTRYRDELVKFDLLWLLAQSLQIPERPEIKYYGVKLKEENSSEELLKRTQRMIDHKRRWIGFLSSQGINFIEAGRLVIRDVSGQKAKEPELTFEEKGVDVRMAVDLVSDAASGRVKTVIVASSDTDLLPAMQAAHQHGAKVIYLAHERRTNDVLIGAADEVKTFTSKQIKEAFKRVN